MHIPDGVLPAAVCGAGYAAAAPVAWYSLRKIKQENNSRENIPKAAILTAAFFVVSWIHIPVPPTSVHLILNGLLGVILGYYAFPAILIGLFFQAVMFQHGGLTTLGVNAIIIGIPALMAHHIFRLRNLRSEAGRITTGIFGFVAGFGAIGLSAVLFLVILISFIPAGLDVEVERAAIYTLAVGHIPLMFIEGAFTALLAVFLQRVRPLLLAKT
ncbi:MAG: cobalt transporter CbiM [Dehalococcoidia bacterium]|nr:MAG: cobalt transporter CbiM [Dehalococcoidia bacterium]